ncbi:MAG: aminopeptidase P family protein [Chloroflexi bacterium]|nr:aminopeptidase P family protein [Chloroflexota bacterium]
MTPRYAQRRARVADALRQEGLDALALNPGPALTYLFGHRFLLLERPILGIITREGRSALIVPELERAAATRVLPDGVYAYPDDPDQWAPAVTRALRELGLTQGRIGIEPNRLRVQELWLLQQAAPAARIVDAGPLLAEQRAVKDPEELAAIRRAVAVAEAAWRDLLPQWQPGVTEAEMARRLTVALLALGSQTELPFEPIIAFGEHAAEPHAQPGERVLVEGDLILVDWGARVDGYVSDMTRLAILSSTVPEDLAHAATAVQDAVNAALRAARVGAPAGAVDQAARATLAAQGLADAFIHRTGHGLGLDVHEPPYLYEGNERALQARMVFTIEPGVYLPGRWGVRWEHMVHLTDEGPEVLTQLPLDIVRLRA